MLAIDKATPVVWKTSLHQRSLQFSTHNWLTQERVVTLLASLSHHLQIIVYLQFRLQGDLWYFTFWEWRKILFFFTITSWWISANTDILKGKLFFFLDLWGHSPLSVNQCRICLAVSSSCTNHLVWVVFCYMNWWVRGDIGSV